METNRRLCKVFSRETLPYNGRPPSDSSPTMTPEDIARIDREHIWHPYSSTTSPVTSYPVVRAEGVHIHLADGCRRSEGVSAWWEAIRGYIHPALSGAARGQLEYCGHVMFGGLTRRPAARLVQSLVDITPGNLEEVFLCDSGSVSVEV